MNLKKVINLLDNTVNQSSKFGMHVELITQIVK